jgi:hypothetical protein
MWDLILGLVSLLGLAPSDTKSADKVQKTMGNVLERGRWFVYAVIVLAVALLAVVGVVLLVVD